MKIILITRDRPELTRQTIKTMANNAADWKKHNLVVVFDGTEEEAGTEDRHNGPFDLIVTGKQLGVGGAKNFGAAWFDKLLENEVLMFSDNDMYYLPNWDKRLEEAFHGNITQLGGWKHPFHGIAGWSENLDSEGKEALLGVDAVTGNCFIIRHKDWLKYGPFDSNALGPGQSEDFALSQKILKDGGYIASLDPPVAIHCGLRNCEGKPAVGWEEMATMAEKQITDNNITKIWLEVPDEGTIQLERAAVEGMAERSTFSGLNVGSGQRRFDTAYGWINVDCVSRPPDQLPDVVLDATKLTTSFAPGSQDIVVLHHVIEHFGCGEADEVLKQCYTVLKPSGSLLIFVPDLRRLAGRWLSGELDDFSYMVNLYGAYQGLDGDRHKWGYDECTLDEYLLVTLPDAKKIIPFDWHTIPGADIAKDWWILGVEVIK